MSDTHDIPWMILDIAQKSQEVVVMNMYNGTKFRIQVGSITGSYKKIELTDDLKKKIIKNRLMEK